MLIESSQTALYLNLGLIAWVRVEDAGAALRVVFVNGREFTYNVHTYRDEVFVKGLVTRLGDDKRFLLLRRETEFVNLGNVLRVTVEKDHGTAQVWYPNGENYVFSGADCDKIRASISGATD